jgi:hypothetical protein
MPGTGMACQELLGTDRDWRFLFNFRDFINVLIDVHGMSFIEVSESCSRYMAPPNISDVLGGYQ